MGMLEHVRIWLGIIPEREKWMVKGVRWEGSWNAGEGLASDDSGALHPRTGMQGKVWSVGV